MESEAARRLTGLSRIAVARQAAYATTRLPLDTRAASSGPEHDVASFVQAGGAGRDVPDPGLVKEPGQIFTPSLNAKSALRACWSRPSARGQLK